MSTTPAEKITITICGDGGCGKSSITLRLVRSLWVTTYDPTIEDSYSITRNIDGQTYHLSLTDTAGQEEYRGMWAHSNLRSDAFLLVYDITNSSSLDELEAFNSLIEIEDETRWEAWECSNRNERRKRGAGPVRPVKIVAGNKCDLQQHREVSAQMGLEWARRHGCGFMETSARNTVNIEETFELIVRRVIEARRAAQSGYDLTAGWDDPRNPAPVSMRNSADDDVDTRPTSKLRHFLSSEKDNLAYGRQHSRWRWTHLSWWRRKVVCPFGVLA